MSRKLPSFIPKLKAPISLMGVAKVVCQAPLSFVETLAILITQPTTIVCLVATLCENGGTPQVMVRSEDFCVSYSSPSSF
jgi:hypothetical protein